MPCLTCNWIYGLFMIAHQSSIHNLNASTFRPLKVKNKNNHSYFSMVSILQHNLFCSVWLIFHKSAEIMSYLLHNLVTFKTVLGFLDCLVLCKDCYTNQFWDMSVLCVAVAQSSIPALAPCEELAMYCDGCTVWTSTCDVHHFLISQCLY